IANCFKSLGAVAAIAGKPAQAARLFGAAETIWVQIGVPPSAVEQPWLNQAYAPARAQLSAEAFESAWAAGRAMPVEQAIDEALEVAHQVTSKQFMSPENASGLTPRECEVLRQ